MVLLGVKANIFLKEKKHALEETFQQFLVHISNFTENKLKIFLWYTV